LEQVLEQLPVDSSLPLFGVPFAVKDNIDVEGWPTTAGCREFTYTAQADATVVRKLREAGAIPIGKTNLDQFATGLVGTRSPFGIPRSVFDENYISGGSSSGSAVAVAAGLVSFALGTDTAGSGRVPAAFNGIVGLKPTRGLLGMGGVVPACRSLDCVSIFSACVTDAAEILQHTRGIDGRDPFSRMPPKTPALPAGKLRIGVPPREQLEFFGDRAAAQLFDEAVERMERFGHACVGIDFTPFRDAAKLLYSGPWVAERLAAIEPFVAGHAGAMHPVTASIITGGSQFSAVDAFRGLYELERLRGLAAGEWTKMDALMLPTTGTIYTVEQVLADPVALNTNLGFYTNFVNLLDLCGIAIPAGKRSPSGLPFGVTLLATAFQDELVCRLGATFLGEPVAPAADNGVALAVVGAHLSGQPLNHQLTDRGGRLIRTCRTAPHYRLFALANTAPPKPGLVRVPDFAGPGIEVEVWSLTPEAFGDFVAQVPQPMVIGTVELADGNRCKGFLCEPCACDGAVDITALGGWRSYLAQK
jgi:allophanate hydrolase